MSIRRRWINLLYNTATGTRQMRKILTPIGLVIFGGFFASFIGLAILVDTALNLPWPIPDKLSCLIAAPLMAAGIAAVGWSAIHFLRVKGTPVPFNPPPVLVISGPYRFARNPMLTGIFLLLFGIGFAIQSPSLIVVFTPLFILTNIWELKKIEEPELIERLGNEYKSYLGRTPMFIPRIKRNK